MTSPALQKWIRKAGKQSARYRSIYSLIFGVGGFRYFIYRTRLQFMNLSARIVLHALEYFLIFHTMPSFLLPVMLLRVSVIAIESGWWGMMDGMRQRIRSLHEKSDASAIRREIEDWVAIAQRMALIVMCIGAGATVFLSDTASQAVLTIAFTLYLSARLILRTLYSGVYALRRIYVRFEWIVAAEFTVFAVAWMLKPILGEWTLPACIITAGVLSSLISFHFVRYSLEFMQLSPRKLIMPLDLSRMLRSYQFSQLWAPGLAMVSTRIHDIVFIVALQFGDSRGVETTGLLFAFYLIIPAVRTAMGWTQILYFDLVRQHLDTFKGFRGYFERLGLVYALFYGVAIATIAVAVLYYSMPESISYFSLVVLYIVFSSVLGLIQISLFTRERYYLLIAIALLQYSLLFVLFAYTFSLATIFATSIVLPAIIGLVVMITSGGRNERSDRQYLRWVRGVIDSEQPKKLVLIRLFEMQSKGIKKQLADHFSPLLGEGASHCFYQEYFLATVDNKTELTQKKLDELMLVGGGYVAQTCMYNTSDGKEIARILYEKHKLPMAFNKHTAEEVSLAFKKMFPDGLVQIPARRNLQVNERVSSDDMYIITKNVLAFAEGNSMYADTDWFISSLQHKGLIEAIFLVKKQNTTAEQRTAWLGYISGHDEFSASD